MYAFAMDRERAAEIYEDGYARGREEAFEELEDTIDFFAWLTEKLGFDTTVGGLDPKTGIADSATTPLGAWLNAWRMRSPVEDGE